MKLIKWNQELTEKLPKQDPCQLLAGLNITQKYSEILATIRVESTAWQDLSSELDFNLILKNPARLLLIKNIKQIE